MPTVQIPGPISPAKFLLVAYVAAFTSAILGLGILILSFIPGTFIDPRDKDASAALLITGVGIAGVFLLLGLALFLLRKFDLIEDANPQRKA